MYTSRAVFLTLIMVCFAYARSKKRATKITKISPSSKLSWRLYLSAKGDEVNQFSEIQYMNKCTVLLWSERRALQTTNEDDDK